MNTIEITPQMILRARLMEAKTLEKLQFKRNYTGVDKENRYFTGYLGELVFEKFLQKNGKKYTYDPKTDGNSQGADFIVIAHRDLEVEIKTTGSESVNKLIIPAKQLDWRSADIYIGIKVSEKIGRIYGWCFKQNLSYDPDFVWKGNRTYYILYTSLFPINSLLPKLQGIPQQITP